MRALILGSDRRMYRLVRRLVDRAGFESFCVARSDEFQDGYTGFHPDCVFLDPDLASGGCAAALRFLADQHSEAMVVVMGSPPIARGKSPQEIGESLGLNMLGALSNEFSIDDVNARLEQIRRVKP